MTLFRILLLGLVLLIVAISGVSLQLNVHASQRFLTAQLQAHAQDTATSLGLSLSPVLARNDWVLAESMLDSIFDQGEFSKIALASLDGRHRIVRSREHSSASVPSWFEAMVPLHPQRVSSDINGRWRLVAKLEVEASSVSSKRLLWQLTKQGLLAALALAIVALLLGSLLLTRLLKPLKLAEQQAKGLRRQRYLRQSHIPRVRELASLVNTMNLMVDNSEAQFKQQCLRMERLRKRTLQDEETGLGNQARYQQQLEQALKDREHAGGVVLMVHLTGLDKVELKGGLGGEQCLLVKVATELQQFALQLPLGRAYRIGFAEFALLFAGAGGGDVADLEAPVRQRISVSLRQSGGERVIFAGCDYQHNDTSTLISQQLEQALSQALGQGSSSVFYLANEQQLSTPLAQQPQLLQTILTTPIRMLAQPVQQRDGRVLHQELLARFSDGQRWLNPAPVMAMVARQQCHKQFDLWVLDGLIGRLRQQPRSEPVSCNLTAESVLDPLMAGQLQRRLKGLWSQVLLEVPERALRIDAELCQRFVQQLHGAGARIWLDHTTPSGLQLLAQPGLEGIKLDPGYTRALLQQESHSDLIELMVAAAHSRGIQVVAQQVEEPELANQLWQLGVDGVQGFGVSAPRPFSSADGPVSLPTPDNKP